MIIPNLQKTLSSKERHVLNLKTNNSGQKKLSFLILSFTLFLATALMHEFDFKLYNNEFQESYRMAFDHSSLMREDLIKLLNREPTSLEIEDRLSKSMIANDGKNHERIFAFIFIFLFPYIALILAITYPKSQPIVFDKKRRVIYTLVRRTLYIAQIPVASHSKNHPNSFFYEAEGLKVDTPHEVHFSLEVTLAKAKNREKFKTFRCGSIPVDNFGSPYGDAVYDFIKDFNYDLVTEDDLKSSVSTFTTLDIIRFIFDHSFFYYRNRTRDSRILKRIDQYIEKTPNPYIDKILGNGLYIGTKEYKVEITRDKILNNGTRRYIKGVH
jgi:hypothetical protein